MTRSHTFKPISTKDGRRTFSNFYDIRFFMPLPEERRNTAHWRYVRDLIAPATNNGAKYAAMDLRAQFEPALKVDGLL
jgi:hypothetical protein